MKLGPVTITAHVNPGPAWLCRLRGHLWGTFYGWSAHGGGGDRFNGHRYCRRHRCPAELQYVDTPNADVTAGTVVKERDPHR